MRTYEGKCWGASEGRQTSSRRVVSSSLGGRRFGGPWAQNYVASPARPFFLTDVVFGSSWFWCFRSNGRAIASIPWIFHWNPSGISRFEILSGPRFVFRRVTPVSGSYAQNHFPFVYLLVSVSNAPSKPFLSRKVMLFFFPDDGLFYLDSRLCQPTRSLFPFDHLL